LLPLLDDASRRLASARPALAPKCKRYLLTGPYGTFFKTFLLTRTVIPYIFGFSRDKMNLVRFGHKGLRRLYGKGDAKGVPAGMADKLRKLLLALETAESLEQVQRFPGWKLHPLKADLEGYWSLSVTGNWRLIFRYEEGENTASDLDLIDYH
jgi:toxin HigB-1